MTTTETHIAQRLQKAGYETARFGVQHVTSHPERLGYDTIHSLTSALEMGTAAAEFLRHPQHQERPLYLEVGFFEPRRPYHWQGIQRGESRGVEVPPYYAGLPRITLAVRGTAGRHSRAGRRCGFPSPGSP